MAFKATWVAEGDAIDYTPGVAVGAGSVVVQNGMLGIANLDIEANQLGALHTKGVYDIEKETGAVVAGQDVFYKTAGDPVSGTAGSGAASTSGAGVYAGKATQAAAANDTHVRVRLAGTRPETPLANIIADPGNAGAIPVKNSGSVQLVTAGAETRTLAVPTYVGQQMAISMKTDGGDAVVTVAAAINATGNNTVTFNDAGDTIVLLGIENGANKRWKIIANDGAALSTV